MLSIFLKNLSILKKFLFINFIVFLVIGVLTFVYLNSIQPSLIKDKTSIHLKPLKLFVNMEKETSEKLSLLFY